MIGKEAKKRELLENLNGIYEQISREQQIMIGDFPPVQKMRELLKNQDFKSFNSLQKKLIEGVDVMLSKEVARLMELIPQVRFINAFFLVMLKHDLSLK